MAFRAIWSIGQPTCMQMDLLLQELDLILLKNRVSAELEYLLSMYLHFKLKFKEGFARMMNFLVDSATSESHNKCVLLYGQSLNWQDEQSSLCLPYRCYFYEQNKNIFWGAWVPGQEPCMPHSTVWSERRIKSCPVVDFWFAETHISVRKMETEFDSIIWRLGTFWVYAGVWASTGIPSRLRDGVKPLKSLGTHSPWDGYGYG